MLHTHTLLHTDAFTHRRFYTTDAFTHRWFYTQTLLHTDAFTHRRFYTCDAFTHRSFYTQKRLHRHFYTQTLLHTDTFTHRRFYTQTLLHTDTFTHKRFCTQTLLHTDAFTHRRFYTQALLHTDTFTHRHFYTQTLLHTGAFTHRRFYTQTLLHTDAASFRAKGFAGQEGRLEIAILPELLAIEPHFVRKDFTSVFDDRTSFRAKGLRGTTWKSQFYLSFQRSNLISCEKVARDNLKSQFLGSHLITKNAHIPLSSTKKYFHGHMLFSRPFALPFTISRFARFSRAIQRFSAAKCTIFPGQILFSRPYLGSTAKPFFRSHLAKRPLVLFCDQTAPQVLPQFLAIEPHFVRKGSRDKRDD